MKVICIRVFGKNITLFFYRPIWSHYYNSFFIFILHLTSWQRIQLIEFHFSLWSDFWKCDHKFSIIKFAFKSINNKLFDWIDSFETASFALIIFLSFSVESSFFCTWWHNFDSLEIYLLWDPKSQFMIDMKSDHNKSIPMNETTNSF